MNNQNVQNSGWSSSPRAPSSIPIATSQNAVRYPMNKQTNFFLCRHCRNHISCWTNGIQRVHGAKGNAILCRDAVNVNTDPRPSDTIWMPLYYTIFSSTAIGLSTVYAKEIIYFIRIRHCIGMETSCVMLTQISQSKMTKPLKSEFIKNAILTRKKQLLLVLFFIFSLHPFRVLLIVIKIL
ncbi:uncharacterized protein [Gossypium hirsutum]|uniref:Uncharacterized protein isoform X2 n=1 Tax=Gossypium hirsutum TaxID=3635 RepID=A0ABM2ZUG4_GOSHI|nr:uncharacterized protein LOC107950882 isoform X2 [Gossypium hirsutum]